MCLIILANNNNPDTPAFFSEDLQHPKKIKNIQNSCVGRFSPDNVQMLEFRAYQGTLFGFLPN